MLINAYIRPATNITSSGLGKLVFLGYGMHYALKGILLPSIINEFSISFTHSGLLLASITVTFLISVITSNKFVQAVGQRVAITIHAFGLVLAGIIMIVAHNILFIALAMILSGWCYGGIECITTAFIKRFNPETPHIAVNNVFSFFCIGSCISALLGGYFVYSGLNWRLCYVVVCIVCLIGAMISIFFNDRVKGTMSKINFSQIKSILRNMPFLLGCAAIGLFAGTEASTCNWMTTFLTNSVDMNIFESSCIAALFYASLYVGRILCGILLRRYNARKIAIGMCISGAILILTVSLVNSPILMWFAVAAFGFTISGLYPLLLSSASSLADESVVYSFTFIAISLGNMFVAATIGIVADTLGIQSTFSFNGIILGLVALLVFLNRKNYDRIIRNND